MRDGRVWSNVIDASESGGSVQLVATGQSAAKLMRVRRGVPGMCIFEISSTLQSEDTTAAGPILYAEVDWQVGRGTQRATVEVGRACVFTVAAAEVVDIKTYLSTSTSTSVYNVSGTCAPCEAMAPIPAYMTEAATVIAGGSNTFDAPPWARAFRVYAVESGLAAATVIQYRSFVAAGGRVMSQIVPIGERIPLIRGATRVNVSSAIAATLIMTWELFL